MEEPINDKITRLIRYLQSSRCLLILDNLESILEKGDSTGSFRKGYEHYGSLLHRLGESSHQSCLILTSREKTRDITELEGEKLLVRSLQILGLGDLEGKEVLKDKGISILQEGWEELVKLYNGNPLALKIVSTHINEVVVLFSKGQRK